MSTESDIEKSINRAETPLVGLPVFTASPSTTTTPSPFTAILAKLENEQEQQSTEKIVEAETELEGESSKKAVEDAPLTFVSTIVTEIRTTTINNGNGNGEAAVEIVDAIKKDVDEKKQSSSESTTIPIEQSQSQEQSQEQLPRESADKDKMDSDASLGNFKILYLLTQLAGLTAIGVCAAWVGAYLGGVGWRAYPSLEFNWHPLFMTIGLIFLYGNSILVYRGFRHLHKKQLKITHACIHMAALVLTIIALITVFDSHNFADPPIPNLYSIHSWIGLSAVIVFLLQYVFGFVTYLFPGVKDSFKIALMPLHVYFGILGFALATAAAISGINEKLIFAGNYAALPTSSLLGNLLGVFIIVFAALVGYLVTEPSYKRKPLPEDMVLLTGLNE